MAGADDDLATAELLILEQRIMHGLFFCHLVIEKALKAHAVKTSGDFAPRSHNLIYLAELTELNINDETQMFFGILMKYQLEGRYPDYHPVQPDVLMVNQNFEKNKTLSQWLKERL